MRTGFKHLEEEKFYRDYLHRLDARAVLTYYGAENCRDIPGANGTTEVVHSCLLDSIERHHRDGDRNPSASCNIEKKKYICWAYWGGDLFHLIMKLENKDELTDIVPIISDLLTGAVAEPDNFKDQLNRLFERESAYTIDLPEYHPRILRPWLLSHPYLREERGISVEASSRLSIGWNDGTNRIVFPHYWMGKLVGWQERAIPHREGRWPGSVPQEPKYKSTGGFPKSETLYGYDIVKDCRFSSVIVVESPMSVAKAHSLGIENVVATFGATVSTTQVEHLKEFGRVHVWMDDDPAGKKAEGRLVKGLWKYTEVKVVATDTGMDLGDYQSAEDVHRKLDTSVPAFIKIPEYS